MNWRIVLENMTSSGPLSRLGPARPGPVAEDSSTTSVGQTGSRPAVRASVDSPLPWARTRIGLLEVSGWATVGGQPVRAVTVGLTTRRGVSKARQATRVDRPDVARFLGLSDGRGLGWRALFDITEDDVGTAQVVLWVQSTVESTAERVIARRFRIVGRRLLQPRDGRGEKGNLAPWLSGALDEPKAGTRRVRRDILAIRGWAWSVDEQPVDEVELFLDDKSIGLARPGMHRPDVAAGLGEPEAALCGFEHYIDLAALPKDTARVRLRAVARSGGREATLDERHLRLARRNYAQQGSPGLSLPLPNPGQRGQRGLQPGAMSSTRQPATMRAQASLSRPDTSPDLNLLVVTHDLGLGGGQLWLSELLLQATAGSRFPCTLLSPKDGPLRSTLEQAGITVTVTDDFPLADPRAYERYLHEQARVSTRAGHNAVLVNTAGAFPGADLAMRLGLPCAWAIHESWPPSEFLRVNFAPGTVHPRMHTVFLDLLSRAPALLFEANSTRLLYLNSTRPGAAIVVRYGINLAEIADYCRVVSREEARARLQIRPEQRVILVLGTLEPRKSQTLITQAFRRVAPDFEHVSLAMVGAREDLYSEALRYYVETAGLADRVRLVPITNDIYSWYRASDLFLCGSDVESLPRTILEAMAFGVPVLATSVFGIPELIAHGVNGFLYSPRSVASATNALRHVLTLAPANLAAVAEAGRQAVTQRHDSREYAQTTLRILNSLRTHPDATASEALRRQHTAAFPSSS